MICIKGMKELPKTCDDCPFCVCHSDLRDFCVASEEHFKTPFDMRHEKCPLIEINLISELEKIRAEILKEYPCGNNPKDKTIGYGIHIALEFLDKYISELKGSD